MFIIIKYIHDADIINMYLVKNVYTKKSHLLNVNKL